MKAFLSQIGWYANPLFYGDYPSVVKEFIGRRSKLQGFKDSRLPQFTPEEKEYLKGTVDFLGINVYTTSLASPGWNYSINNWSCAADSGVVFSQKIEWPTAASKWLKVGK